MIVSQSGKLSDDIIRRSPSGDVVPFPLRDAGQPPDRASAEPGDAPRTSRDVNPKLNAALDLAERRGLRVFPCVPGGKEPAIAGWQLFATTSPKQITAWWEQNPEYNIGVLGDNLCVVDIDVKNNGPKNFEDYLAYHASLDEKLPPTFRVKTQSGGTHLYFRTPLEMHKGKWRPVRIRNSGSKIARGVDIKAYHGYVVGPGSMINGNEYVVIDDVPIETSPDWFVAEAKKSRVRSTDAGKRVSPETDAAIEAATKYIEDRAPEAEEGSRNNTAFIVAATLYDYGVEEPTCRELMYDWNEAKCFPPLDLEEIETIVASAGVNRQNLIGHLNPDVDLRNLGYEPHEVEPGSEKLAPDYVPPADAFAPKIIEIGLSAEAIKPREWVIENMAVKGRVSVLIGPGGVAKSTWMNQAGIAVATGRSDVCGFNVPRRDMAWIWNQEDDEEEINRRMIAALQHFKMTPADLYDGSRGLLARNSGVEAPLIIARESGGAVVVNREAIALMIRYVKEFGVSLLQVDPLVELHRVRELDNGDMARVWGALREVALSGCAVLVAAHTRKPPNGDSEAHIGQLDALRGASAQGNVIRKAETMFSPSVKDEKRFAFPNPRLEYARMDDAKNNVGRKRLEPVWFRRIGVRIANGEDVGVLNPVTLAPRVETGLDRATLVARALAARNAPAGVYVPLADLVAAMAPEHRSMFDTPKKKESLRKSFQDDETLVDDRKLLQKKAPTDKGGHLYALGPGLNPPPSGGE
jgi:Bifunctional DNA primase/polymerase, N-terminal/AAA domain/Primase C terminal 1 (PriCT-1)